MRYKALSNNLFRDNRRNFIEHMKPNSISVFFSADEFPKNGDQFFKFRQNSNLFYLSGIDQPKTILVLIRRKKSFEEILFIKEVDEKERIWNGEVLEFDEATNISGVKKVESFNDFNTIAHPKIKKADFVYYWENDYKNFATPVNYNEKRSSDKLKRKFKDKKFLHSGEILKELRLVKSEEEISVMKKAVEITKKAYLSVLKNIRVNKFEYEIEAEMTYEFVKNGASGHAYDPIVATGRNACYLHYTDNDDKINDGDLVLMDFGAEYANYAADCSRTIPANGKYTARQKECYNAVLDVYKRAQQLFVPGNTIRKINEQVGLWMQEKMIELGLFTLEDVENQDNENPVFKKYFMHGTSHFIGLDVHDTGDLDTEFKKGMVLTCEPGLYIPEEKLGIRIETDIVVDENPIDLMEDFPVEVDEIEDCMA